MVPTPHRYYSVRVNPYAHSQHIKVLKHIVYIQYRCGMQSEASCSFNHDTPVSFGFAHTPIFQNLAPTPLTGITVCKGKLICPFTAYQGAKTKTLCIHPIWMWDAVSLTIFSLNHDNPTSFGFAHTPIFQKLAPSYLQMYYSVRVNPYAHPQHIKVLKHIVCILDGCGLQSEASCSINHDTTSSFGFTQTPTCQNLAPSRSI
jgi:hypothetical protein